MSVHLFTGRQEGDDVVVTSGITLCCRVHTLGLGKGERGTVDPTAVTCPAYEPSADDLKVIYPTVEVFADRMRAELWRNRANGDRAGWLSMSPKQLYFEASWHVGKLVVPLKDYDREALLEHAADIGNAAMFIMDYADAGVPWES